jgi:hypothetical protein
VKKMLNGRTNYELPEDFAGVDVGFAADASGRVQLPMRRRGIAGWPWWVFVLAGAVILAASAAGGRVVLKRMR